MFYVYFLKNEKDEIYYGSTNNLKRRFLEHNSGKSLATKGHKWILVYYEAYRSEKDAWEREKQLKYHGQALAKVKQRIRQSFKES